MELQALRILLMTQINGMLEMEFQHAEHERCRHIRRIRHITKCIPIYSYILVYAPSARHAATHADAYRRVHENDDESIVVYFIRGEPSKLQHYLDMSVGVDFDRICVGQIGELDLAVAIVARGQNSKIIKSNAAFNYFDGLLFCLRI